MTIIIEHDLETGEVIEREMTKAELAQVAKDQAEAQTQKDQEAEKAAAKAALLAQLGITEDQAKLLLG